MATERFPLAPMSPLVRNLTIGLLLLPVILAIAALVLWQWELAGIALLIAVLYAGVWFGCRPVAFEVNDHDLVIVFPVWQRRLPLATITAVQPISSAGFLQRFGWVLRVGVAGLWGGFGWLWTSRKGWVEFYVSRTEDFVLIERSGGIPLLLTPRSLDHFVGVLGAKCDRRSL